MAEFGAWNFGAYSEEEIASRIAELPTDGRAQFACACAERLMPPFRWFCDVSGCANFEIMRKVLDVAWAGPGTGLKELESAGEIVGLVPEVEGVMPVVSAVAQNAVASIVYAVEVRQTGDVQDAVWAARQLYDAADLVVQQGFPQHTYLEIVDREPPIQLMVRGIYALLDAIQDGVSSADLIANARQDGEAFLAFVTGLQPHNSVES